MRLAWLPALMIVLSGCGGASTSPTGFGVISTVRYERVYPPSGGTPHAMLINVSLPAHKSIPFCMPVQQTETTFACENLKWQVDDGEDATVWVDDPALGHGAARRIFVNGRELTRVATYANGTELASLNWTRSGGFQ